MSSEEFSTPATSPEEKDKPALPNTAQSRFVTNSRGRRVRFLSTMGANGENTAGLGDGNATSSNPATPSSSSTTVGRSVSEIVQEFVEGNKGKHFETLESWLQSDTIVDGFAVVLHLPIRDHGKLLEKAVDATGINIEFQDQYQKELLVLGLCETKGFPWVKDLIELFKSYLADPAALPLHSRLSIESLTGGTDTADPPRDPITEELDHLQQSLANTTISIKPTSSLPIYSNPSIITTSSVYAGSSFRREADLARHRAELRTADLRSTLQAIRKLDNKRKSYGTTNKAIEFSDMKYLSGGGGARVPPKSNGSINSMVQTNTNQGPISLTVMQPRQVRPFDGVDHAKASNFLREYEKLAVNWSDTVKVDNFSQYLEDAAANWFNLIENTLANENTYTSEGMVSNAWKDLTWAELRHLFMKEYLPNITKEFFSSKQEPNELGATFFYKMCRLHTDTPLQLDEESLIEVIVDKMNATYQPEFKFKKFYTLAKLRDAIVSQDKKRTYQLAEKRKANGTTSVTLSLLGLADKKSKLEDFESVEECDFESPGKKDKAQDNAVAAFVAAYTKNLKQGKPNGGNGQNRNQKRNDHSQLDCHFCGKTGHIQRDCFSNPNSNNFRGNRNVSRGNNRGGYRGFGQRQNYNFPYQQRGNGNYGSRGGRNDNYGRHEYDRRSSRDRDYYDNRDRRDYDRRDYDRGGNDRYDRHGDRNRDGRQNNPAIEDGHNRDRRDQENRGGQQ
jgi:hypothetical protein